MKRHILIIVLILVLFGSISLVSAANNDSNVIVKESSDYKSDEVSQSYSTDDVKATNKNDELKSNYNPYGGYPYEFGGGGSFNTDYYDMYDDYDYNQADVRISLKYPKTMDMGQNQKLKIITTNSKNNKPVSAKVNVTIRTDADYRKVYYKIVQTNSKGIGYLNLRGLTCGGNNIKILPYKHNIIGQKECYIKVYKNQKVKFKYAKGVLKSNYFGLKIVSAKFYLKNKRTGTIIVQNPQIKKIKGTFGTMCYYAQLKISKKYKPVKGYVRLWDY